jgi:FAD/FMN-containing dehydrogenase
VTRVVARAGTDPARPYESWGRWPRVRPRAVVPVAWSCDPPDLAALDGPLLAYGLGRSYGDACLNEGGVLLDTSRMDRLLAFDREAGILRCEAGASLAAILEVITPHGWFLPVTPGTRYVTVGGAIANDIHGKNHHRAGTFGCHLSGFDLLRSSGERLWCSPTEHRELFAATIGGLGLTGLMLSAELRLKRVESPHVTMDRRRYGTLHEFFTLSAESDQVFEYTVAWVDCLARGRALGRGVFMRGNHASRGARPRAPRGRMRVPFEAPEFLLGPLSIRAFNAVYYHAAGRRADGVTRHYGPFFYPLDALDRWNLLYGRRGFLQYQCVVPPPVALDAMRAILEVAGRGASFLAVLKQFGAVPSPGLLSFPRPGTTLALDLAFRGEKTLALCDRLDAIVADAGGAVYPGKDARMSPASFRRFFPEAESLRPHLDPAFSSSLWRRVNAA